MAKVDLKNATGGGIHLRSNWQSPQTRLFKAGLKHETQFVMGTLNGGMGRSADIHDKIDYERGAVIHSRSSSNQYFNFQYMFGGFRKYVIQRWFIQNNYRKFWRVAWLPVLISYGIGCYGMRKYDNAAYNFFYFSD